MRIRVTKRGALIGGAILTVLVCWFVFKSYTDPILAPHSVAELHALDVNGDRQWLLERGCDRRKPVLLFLHGGPGMPAMFTAHAFARPLERDFVVVQWDQRGAGKSFHRDLDPATMTFSQLEADALVVVQHLRRTYRTERILLVGHSWGSFFGAHLAAKHPELFEAFVAVGMDADHPGERVVQDRLIRKWFTDRGKKPPVITAANREDLLFETGGELADATSMWPLLQAGFLAPEYSLWNAFAVPKGAQFTHRHLRYDLAGGYGAAPVQFAVPVAVVMGSGDFVTPVSSAKEWYGRVKAPKKAWFEVAGAAHFSHLERPEAFAAIMRQISRRNTGQEPGALPIPRFGLQCL